MPTSRARYTHSATSGKSGLPDNPPPPYFLSGDSPSLLSNFFCASARSFHGIVFDTQIASHEGCSAIFCIALDGTTTLNFAMNGIFNVDKASNDCNASSMILLGSTPAFGQEKFTCN